MSEIKMDSLLKGLKGDYLIYVIDEKFNYEFFGRVSEYSNSIFEEVGVVIEELKFIDKEDIRDMVFKENSLSYQDYEKDRGNIRSSLFEYEEVLLISYSY